MRSRSSREARHQFKIPVYDGSRRFDVAVRVVSVGGNDNLVQVKLTLVPIAGFKGGSSEDGDPDDAPRRWTSLSPTTLPSCRYRSASRLLSAVGGAVSASLRHIRRLRAIAAHCQRGASALGRVNIADGAPRPRSGGSRGSGLTQTLEQHKLDAPLLTPRDEGGATRSSSSAAARAGWNS